jgi:septal ring factor EnvC (AmiA/AmiB activator)
MRAQATSGLKCVLRRLSLAVLVCLIASPALGQQEDNRAKEALRRLQAQQREFNEQKAVLEQAKAKAEKDSADKDKEIKQLQARLKKVETGSNQSASELTHIRAELERTRTELAALGVRHAQERERADKLSDEYRQSVATIGNKDAEEKRLSAMVTDQREIVGRQAGIIQACEDKNAQLARLGGELLRRYRDKGLLDALKQAEPFTQIERVKMENLWQEYRDRIDAGKLDRPVIAQ